MYPSWGNYGGAQSQNYGGPGPRKQPGGGHTGPPAGFGGFEASSGGSLFSSLQEQHLQQMQQLQMLHQKQLQSVLHHGSSTTPYSSGLSSGYSGSPWHSEGPGHLGTGDGAQSYYQQDETVARAPPATKPGGGHQQPPPPPPQLISMEPQQLPPPPEPLSLKPPETGAPKPKEANTNESCTAEDGKTLTLQVM